MSLLAETVATNINWTLICAIVLTVATVGMWWDARRNKTPQPFSVKEVKTLHEQFASLEEFKTLSRHNTERHGQLFDAVKQAKAEARAELALAVNTINTDRAKTMEGLRVEFAAVRSELVSQGKEIAGLQTATDQQDKKLSSMDMKLDRLIERNSS